MPALAARAANSAIWVKLATQYESNTAGMTNKATTNTTATATGWNQAVAGELAERSPADWVSPPGGGAWGFGDGHCISRPASTTVRLRLIHKMAMTATTNGVILR